MADDAEGAPDAPPGLRRRLFADTRPLKESPEFRRLWLGSLASGIGGMMTSVAVPVQVYALTRSSLAVGMIGLALGIPLITLGLLAGSFADTVDRRRLVLITSSAIAAVSLLFAAQAFFNLRQLWLLYLLAAVQSGLVAIDSPARRAFVPRLLPPERIAAASALSFLSFQAGLIVGPLLAGVIIANAGFKAAYAADALSFAFAVYAVLRLRPMPTPGDVHPPGLRAMAQGLDYVRRHPVIGTALLVDLNATIFGMPFALFPALAATRFGGGPETVGWLYAAPAIGGVICATFSGSASHTRRQGLAILLAVGVWGAAIACFALTPVLWIAVVFLAIAGGADVVNGVFRTTIVQTNAPYAFQGRVNSVGFVVGAGGPRLGDVEAGVVAAITSPVISAVAGGVACVIGVGILAATFPAFARYRTPEKR